MDSSVGDCLPLCIAHLVVFLVNELSYFNFSFQTILASISILVVLLSIFYSFSQFLSVPFYELDQLPPTPTKKKKKAHTSLFIVSILIIFQKNYVFKQWGKIKRDCSVLYTEQTIKQFISSTTNLVKQ